MTDDARRKIDAYAEHLFEVLSGRRVSIPMNDQLVPTERERQKFVRRIERTRKSDG